MESPMENNKITITNINASKNNFQNNINNTKGSYENAKYSSSLAQRIQKFNQGQDLNDLNTPVLQNFSQKIPSKTTTIDGTQKFPKSQSFSQNDSIGKLLHPTISGNIIKSPASPTHLKTYSDTFDNDKNIRYSSNNIASLRKSNPSYLRDLDSTTSGTKIDSSNHDLQIPGSTDQSLEHVAGLQGRLRLTKLSASNSNFSNFASTSTPDFKRLNSNSSSLNLNSIANSNVNINSNSNPNDIFNQSSSLNSKKLSSSISANISPLSKNIPVLNSSPSRNWMEKGRQSIQAYEYLCHVGEAKEWIEKCIGEEIPSIVDLEEALRNGVILAKLTQVFAPNLIKRKIFTGSPLQWRHVDNINYFFNFIDQLGVPDLFTFVLVDLYEKKNVPKVIYCIHAISFILYSQGKAPPINDLVGKLNFTEDELSRAQKGLDSAGISLPNFGSMKNKLPQSDSSQNDSSQSTRNIQTNNNLNSISNSASNLSPNSFHSTFSMKSHLSALKRMNEDKSSLKKVDQVRSRLQFSTENKKSLPNSNSHSNIKRWNNYSNNNSNSTPYNQTPITLSDNPLDHDDDIYEIYDEYSNDKSNNSYSSDKSDYEYDDYDIKDSRVLRSNNYTHSKKKNSKPLKSPIYDIDEEDEGILSSDSMDSVEHELIQIRKSFSERKSLFIEVQALIRGNLLRSSLNLPRPAYDRSSRLLKHKSTIKDKTSITKTKLSREPTSTRTSKIPVPTHTAKDSATTHTRKNFVATRTPKDSTTTRISKEPSTTRKAKESSRTQILQENTKTCTSKDSNTTRTSTDSITTRKLKESDVSSRISQKLSTTNKPKKHTVENSDDSESSIDSEFNVTDEEDDKSLVVIDEELPEPTLADIALLVPNEIVVSTQSICRGLLYRAKFKNIHIQLNSLLNDQTVNDGKNHSNVKTRSLIRLQSIARGFLERRRYNSLKSLLNNAFSFKTFSSSNAIPEPEVITIDDDTDEENDYKYNNKTDRSITHKSLNNTFPQTIVLFQSVSRGFLVRSAIRLAKVTLSTLNSQGCISEIQGLIRGFSIRQYLKQIEQQLEFSEFSIKSMQSIIRGVNLRKEILQTRRFLSFSEAQIISLQSMVRAQFSRKKSLTFKENISNSDIKHLNKFFAFCRGKICREQVGILRSQLLSRKVFDSVLINQSLWRAHVVRKDIKSIVHYLKTNEVSFIALQKLCRSFLVKRNYLHIRKSLAPYSYNVFDFQSRVRGFIARRRLFVFHSQLEAHEQAIFRLQNIAKGVIIRKSLGLDLDTIDSSEIRLIRLQAHIRGLQIRRSMRCFKLIFHSKPSIQSVTLFQSLIRGEMMRFEYHLLLKEIKDAACPKIFYLQARAKGYLVRKYHNDVISYYINNIKKVIKAQSIVRTKLQEKAYKDLITKKNPPLGAIRPFVHLLNDDNNDFEEEVSVEKARQSLNKEIRHIETLEQYIDQLDIKIALLVKNKITLDELLSHKNSFKLHSLKYKDNVNSLNTVPYSYRKSMDLGLGFGSSTNPRNSFPASTNSFIKGFDRFDLKALNKASRKRLELYQSLFFILQTQPKYFSHLFYSFQMEGASDTEIKALISGILITYGRAHKPREEYYLLNLLVTSAREAVEKDVNNAFNLRDNFIWWRLFVKFVRNTPDYSNFLRTLLLPLIKMVIDAPDLDMESDPLVIYRTIINKEELASGKRSQKDRNVTVETAIQEPETREMFIKNLQQLREVCSEFMKDIEKSVPETPYGVKYFAKQVYLKFKELHPKETENKALTIVGHVFFVQFIYPAIVSPELYGIVEEGVIGPTQRKNLMEVSNVLTNIFNGVRFGSENMFLQPLNEYLDSVFPDALKADYRLISEIPSLEEHFRFSYIDDITAKNRPVLYLKIADMLTVHRLVISNMGKMGCTESDPLSQVIRDLGTDINDDNYAFSNISESSNAEIKLELNPNSVALISSDDDTQSLMLEVKYYLSYVIRVQSGQNLVEVLLKPISPADETKFQAILVEERALKRAMIRTFSAVDLTQSAADSYVVSAYAANASSIDSLQYSEVKRRALEKLLQLEKTGKVSRKDNYQVVLNSIAVDLRTQHNRRVGRGKELSNIQSAMGQITDKEKYLSNKLNSYNNYIEQAMSTLQSKKGKNKKRFFLPFSTQYFHTRGLQRKGHMPKFGSYKYSAGKLLEKGVLADLSTEYTSQSRERLYFTISCDQVGVFNIEAAYGSVSLPGANVEITLDDLLTKQFDNQQYISLFDNKAKFNTNILLHLIYKKFYSAS